MRPRIRFHNAFIPKVAILEYEERLMIPKVITALLIATLVLFFSAKPSFSLQNTLTLTVTTNKQVYGLSDFVYVGGILAYQPNTNYVSQAIVGVEVRNPRGNSFILRALPTGLIASQNWLVNFTEFYPCDAPRSSEI